MRPWTEEEIAEASRLWKDGFSAARIGEKLGRTRQMVVGIAFRNREMFPNREATITIKRASPRRYNSFPEFQSKRASKASLRLAVSNKQVIGSPRQFERGFTTTFEGLQSFCEKHGFKLLMDKSWWTLRRDGQQGRPMRLTRREAIKAIDNRIRIPAGLQPILGA